MGSVGPHEGREFELLQSGEKHVAYFSEIIPNEIERFADALGATVHCFDQSYEINGRERTVPAVIIAANGYQREAERLRYLVTTTHEFNADVEREIGQILGYSKADIEAFIVRCTEQKGQPE